MVKEKARYYKSCITNKGTRRLNEDSYFVEFVETTSSFGIFAAVADGLGGLDRGEIVSGYIKQSLCKWYRSVGASLFQKTNEEIKEMLNEEITNIHKVLLLNAQKKKIVYGSTLTAILITNSRFIIAHVGDSRAYIYYRDIIRQLTKDQTQYQKLMESGEEIPAAKKQKMQSTLLQCIGNSTLTTRFYEGILPDEYELLLCTDGFYKHQSKEEIKEFFTKALPLQRRLNSVVTTLLERGESDNITAVLIKKIYERE